MTHQLKGQRETLLSNNRQIEERRRLFDSVLTSVTSGVIGLDTEGRITFINRSAERIPRADDAIESTTPLEVVVPEFCPMLERMRETESETEQEEIRLSRRGVAESLLVRLAIRRNADWIEDESLRAAMLALADSMQNRTD